MTPSVCRGLQSCIEPRLVESSILMPPPNKSNIFHTLSFLEKKNQDQEAASHSEKENEDTNLGGWSFSQTLCNTSQTSKQCIDTEQVYVHPLGKRNSSTLSTKSLKMCTESLGSETGSDVSETENEFPSMVMEPHNTRPRSRKFTKKASGAAMNFPPPLTSITGSDGVQVRPHREGGRLVLKAVTVPSLNPKFQAERADGRLHLSFLDLEVYECEENGGCSQDSEEVAGVEVDDEGSGGSDSLEDVKKRNNGDDDDGDGEVGSEKEVGEYPRRSSRSKEGGNRNKAMTDWGTLWVAISLKSYLSDF